MSLGQQEEIQILPSNKSNDPLGILIAENKPFGDDNADPLGILKKKSKNNEAISLAASKGLSQTAGTIASPTLSPVQEEVKIQEKTQPDRIKTYSTFSFGNPPNTEEIKTADGSSLFVNRSDKFFSNPAYVVDIQQRVANKTATQQDIANLAAATGKSTTAIDAYVNKDKQVGFAVETVEKIDKTKSNLEKTILDFNQKYGTDFDSNAILASPEKASEFYNSFQEIPKAQAEKVSEDILLGGGDIAAKYTAIFPADYENNLGALQNYIVNQTVVEDRANGVPQKETIAKIAERTDPRGYAQYLKTLTPNAANPTNVVALAGMAYDALFGNGDKDELLNSVKGQAALRYNDAIQQTALNKISQGILSRDENMVNEGKSDLNSIDENTIYEYPSLMKQEMVRRVNETIARESGQLQGSETKDLGLKIVGANLLDYAKVMKDLGYLDDPKTKDLAESLLNHTELFADASYAGGIGQAFLQPFKDLGLSVADITGFRNERDVLSDKKKAELFPQELANTKADFSLPVIGEVRVRNVLNTTANLAGMTVIAAATEGLGTTAGLSTTAAKSLGAYTSFGLPSYDAALKESYNFLDNDGARTLYATIMAVTNAEGGRLLDLPAMLSPEVKATFGKIASGLTEKTIEKKAVSELLGETKNKYIDFAVKYGKNVTKGAATMAYFNITNNIERLAFGDPTIAANDIIPEAGHAFIDGVTGMSILGAFGAAAERNRERNTTYKGFIYDMALNKDAAADVFKIGLQSGKYSEKEYNEKVQILNTSVAAKGAVDAAQLQTGITLNENQKAVYVANKTAVGVLRKKLEDTPAENKDQIDLYNSQIGRLEQQTKDVMEGLKFSPTLEPLYDLFEAEREYNKAIDEVSNGNGTLAQVEAAKSKVDAAVEVHQNTLTPKVKEVTATEPITVEAKPIAEGETAQAFNRAIPQLSEEQVSVVQPVIDRVVKSESVNEVELNKAQDVLYEALDKNSGASHLIEPLINKLQDYGLTTKTETGTVTEKIPIEGAFAAKSREAIKPALELSTGSEAAIASADGTVKDGKLSLVEGNYVLEVPNSENVVIGEKAITDRDLKLPSIEKVAEPITMDADGNVSAVTFETSKGDLVTIKNPEKALDIAIQLQAEAIGKIPDAAFEQAYNEVQKEVTTEVPVNTKVADNTQILIQEYRDKNNVTGEAVPDNELLKNIAEQAQNISGGKLNETGSPETLYEATVKQAGKELTDKAIETFPKETLLNENAKANEVQQPTENKGTPNKKVDTDSGAAKPPKEEPAKTKPDAEGISITHEATAELRRENDFEAYEKDPKKFEEWDAEADKRIADGKMPSLLRKMEDGKDISAVEQRMMGKYIATLDAEVAKNPTKENIATLKRAVELSDIVGGRQSGQSLAARKGMFLPEDSLGSFLIDKEKAQGFDLSDKQIKSETEKYNELKIAKDKFESALKIEQEKNAVLIAEKGLNRAKQQRKKENKKSKEEYQKERKDTITAAKEALKKLKDNDQPVQSSIVPFSRELSALAPHIKKYFESLVNEGVDKLDNIVNAIHAEFKDVADWLTKNQINEIIGGVHDEKLPTRAEKNQQIRLLKREANLLNQLNKEIAGLAKEKNETKEAQTNARIEALKKQIIDVREFNSMYEDTAKASFEKKEIDRLNNRIKKLENDVKNKKYAEEKPIERPLAITRETQILLDKVIYLENKIQEQRAIDQRNKLSVWQRRWDKVQETLGIRRIVQTAVDASIWFRQLGSLLLNPRKWDIAKKFIISGSKSAFSQQRFDRIQNEIHKSPDFKQSLEDGVRYNDLKAIDPRDANEFYYPRSWVYKIPILREILQSSQRIADGSFNVARYELYEKHKRALEKNGIFRETDPLVYKEMAKLVMNTTGSGNLLKFLETNSKGQRNIAAEKVLGATFYGARLMAANFNTLNPVYYAKMPKAVRIEAMKDLAAYTSTLLTTTLALAAMGGKVSLNPDDSDFLQVRFGEKVYDLTGGKASYIRTFLRLTEAGYARFFKTKSEADKSMKFAGQSFINFFRNKLAPNTGYILNAALGKNSMGQDFDPYEVIKIYPMYVDDAWKAAKEDGFLSLLTVLLPNIMGIGYGSYYSEANQKPLEETLRRNLNSDEMNKDLIKNYNDGGRTINNSEFQEFVNKRDDFIEKQINELYEGTAPENLVLDEQGEIVTKKYSDMTKEEIIAATSSIKKRATQNIKEELFGENKKSSEQKHNESKLRNARKEVINND